MLQDGSMRCDVNVSVRKRKDEAFGTRVEIKNMNSFSAMQKAIEYEIDRQASRPILALYNVITKPCDLLKLLSKEVTANHLQD